MKTPDEIKKGLECCSMYPDRVECMRSCPYESEGLHCIPMLAADAHAYIQQLEAKVSKWISVKDALPEYGKRVLFLTKERRLICVGPYRGEGGRGAQYFFNGNRIETAMWWMHLPEPPKEET